MYLVTTCSTLEPIFYTLVHSSVLQVAVAGRQEKQGLLCWPYKKYNCVKNIFIDLDIIFICVMSTKLPMISLVEVELQYPT